MRGSALVAGSVTWFAVLAAAPAVVSSQPHEGATVDATELHEVSREKPEDEAPPQAGSAPAAEPAEVHAEVHATTSVHVGEHVSHTAEAEAPHDLTEPPPTAAEARWPEADELRRAHNTWFGSTGGVRVIDGASGVPGTLRFQLGFDYFGASDFLEVNDKHRYTSGTLSLSATPIDHLEVFASATSRASSNNSGNPILLQGAGDFSLGAKGYVKLLPWLSVGGDLRALLLNAIGDLGLDGASISAGLRLAATADFRHLQALQLPVILRANVGYYLDNSGQLIEDTENARYNAIPSASRRPRVDEDRHLVNRIERFGLGINRVDMLGFGLGVEAPLKVLPDFFVQPLVEWQLGVPVNRQGFDCLSVPTDASNKGSDGCLAVNGLNAAPSTLTIGARVLPPVRGLSALVAVDIGLLGTSTFVRELAANRPWALLVTIGYTADMFAPKAQPAVQIAPSPVQVAHVEPPPPAAASLRVRGEVVEKGTNKPVIGAVVRYPNQAFTPQLTSADGVFVSYALPAGEASLTLEITHPDYESTHCAVPLPAAAPGQSGLAPVGSSGLAPQPSAADGLVPGRCELSAVAVTSRLDGMVTSADGKALPGVEIELTGPTQRTITSGPAGELKAEALPPGDYFAQVNSQDYLFKRVPFSVVARSDTSLRIMLNQRPKKAQAMLTASEVKIGSQVVFRPSSAEIDTRSTLLLAEVADVLAHNPQVRIVVQGHTDNSGDPTQNRILSQQRADSVRQWLISSGIESSRVEAKGFGDEQPLVPNLTPESRARNRRVQFTLLK